MTKARVTLKDIAKVAGVSTATVSHVLNNTAPISTETSARVLRLSRTSTMNPMWWPAVCGSRNKNHRVYRQYGDE